MPRFAMLIISLLGVGVSSPGFAQIFYKPPEITGGALNAPEPGYGVPLPGAMAGENRAALVWNIRSALNVAALQCANDPLLRIAENYNAVLLNHSEELAAAFASLQGYFKKRNKTPKLAQTAIDVYGTRTYSSFSAVTGILPFCHHAAIVVREAVFQPRGQLGGLAQSRLRLLYNAVKARAGEQQFPGVDFNIPRSLPSLDANCWVGKKNKETYLRSCGFTTRY